MIKLAYVLFLIVTFWSMIGMLVFLGQNINTILITGGVFITTLSLMATIPSILFSVDDKPTDISEEQN